MEPSPLTNRAAEAESPTLLVTTSHKARAETVTRAMAFAVEHGYEFASRGDDSVDTLLTTADAALVMTNDGGMSLATDHGVLKAHLGTAFIRLKSMSRGEGDPLVRAGEIQPGDHVVDTTFGLGRDAIVAACAVGASGAVTALESSNALFHLGRYGTEVGPLSPSEVSNIGERLTPAQIDVVNEPAIPWLKAAESASVDVILVDPMFGEPKTADPGFELLRSVADDSPLTQDWIEQACQVARRWVVVKTGQAPDWLESMGAERVHSHSNATWWRVAGGQQGRP